MSGSNKSTKPDWIDPDDAPDLSSPEWVEKFDRADLYHGERLIRRGRPKVENPKIPINIRLSADVLDSFKQGGRGWQGRIDAALAQWLAEHAAADLK